MSTVGVVNGRVARIREYLARETTPCSGADIRRNADPRASVQQVTETICYMVRKGYAVKFGHGKGKVRYTAGHVMPPTRKPAAALAKPPGAGPLKRHSRPANVTGTPSRLGADTDRQRAASDQIAADIKAFQKRSGRIQRLGVTKVLIHIGADPRPT